MNKNLIKKIIKNTQKRFTILKQEKIFIPVLIIIGILLVVGIFMTLKNREKSIQRGPLRDYPATPTVTKVAH